MVNAEWEISIFFAACAFPVSAIPCSSPRTAFSRPSSINYCNVLIEQVCSCMATRARPCTGKLRSSMSSEHPILGATSRSLKTEEVICRICHSIDCDGELPADNILLAPCLCKGSTKYVHKNVFVVALSVAHCTAGEDINDSEVVLLVQDYSSKNRLQAELLLRPDVCTLCGNRCLDEWRRINKGKQRAAACEICGYGYNVKSISPSFFEYVQQSWSYPEKAIYASAAMSVFMSVVASFKAYLRDRRRRPSVIKRLGYLALLFKYYLYGWPVRSKVVMYGCLMFIVWGNSFLFEHWRQKNVKEVILNHPQRADDDQESKSQSQTPCT